MMSKTRFKPARLAKVSAMLANGATHQEIAQTLNVSTKTIQRASREVRSHVEEADAQLSRLRGAITQHITVDDRAKKYAKLATGAHNEAVSLGALQRIDDLEGIITDKERIRAKGHEQAQPGPMFVLPAGAQVNVTINQAPKASGPSDIIDVEPGDHE